MNSTRGTPAASQPGRGGRGATDPGAGDRGGRGPQYVTAAAYLALFLLGALLGLVGAVQYSQGPVPLAAVLFDLAILATCILGSAGLRSALGGVLPAAGWFVVTLVLSSGTASGSAIGFVTLSSGTIESFWQLGLPQRRFSWVEIR